MKHSPVNCEITLEGEVLKVIPSEGNRVVTLNPTYSIDVEFEDGSIQNFALSEDEYNRIKNDMQNSLGGYCDVL